MCQNRTCDYFYAKEKLGHAISILTTGEEEVRTRLLYATSRLHVLNSPGKLPQSLQDEWLKIYKRLTRFGINYSSSRKEIMGPIEHTMKRIKKKTARVIAEDMCDLLADLKNF